MNKSKIARHSELVSESTTLFQKKGRSRNQYGMTDFQAFTLIELIVSITILSVIMLSVFVIYSNFIQVNRRLEGMRIVQENIRNITEKIATDVREK